jgi:predicted amidohydrolase
MSTGRNLSVSAIQFKPLDNHIPSSLKKLLPLVEAASQISDLVVLPELACTNYLFDSPNEILPFAEKKGGVLFQELQKANRGKAHIIAGFIELGEDNHLYNSAYIVKPESPPEVYRKTLLYDADKTWATPGNLPYPLFSLNGFSVTVGICMDLNDDGFTHFCATNSVDIVALPVNWLDQDEDIRPYWRYRLDYDCLLVAANTYGSEKNIAFRGYSTIMYSHFILAEMGAVGDGLISFDFIEEDF